VIIAGRICGCATQDTAAKESAMHEFFSQTFSNPYVWIVILTLAPFLELRASIPYGILVAKEHYAAVVLTAVVVNILLGPVIYFLLERLLHVALRLGPVRRLWDRVVVRVQKKVHPLVEKYGVLGLGLFIGVPLPGSGVYSGAIGGYLLGFTRKEFYVGTVIGVLIAAAAVTAVVLTGAGAFFIFLKQV
jgi:uncharacterized membrane protein